MLEGLFTLSLFFFSLALQLWAFKNLPEERWQVLASVPVKKISGERWYGINITFYGFFIAMAYCAALSIVTLLLGALGLNIFTSVFINIILGFLCISASKVIARIVEKKKHTFTVGGASFAGLAVTPWILIMLTHPHMPIRVMEKQMVLPVLSALTIAYAFGEGIGRLACISFGCCYGRPVDECGVLVKKIFKNYAFVFKGKTKKASYAHGYENKKLIPVQALTSIIYVTSSISGMYLFLKGFYYLSFLLVAMILQIWRFLSEFLRSDYRGNGSITVYQVMSLASTAYALFIALILPVPASILPDLKSGFFQMWDPFFILFLQFLWWVLLFIFGKSSVTASNINLYVIKENV